MSSSSSSDEDPQSDLPRPPLIPNLPDDIAARCIALLPLSSHPTLSLVSRSWRSLLHPASSPLLFNLRSQLLLPPSPALILSIRLPFSSSSSSLWFLLHPSSPRSSLPLPSPPIPTAGSASCPVGPALYLLGGSHAGLPSRSLQILDCRLRRWDSPGSSMSAAREFPAAAHISGRIYALGGCLPSTPSWAESLDLTANKWTPVPCPVHLRDKWMHGNAVLGGKLLAVADRGGVMFDPATAAWGPVSSTLDLGWKGRAAAVNGLLYSYDYLGQIKGYDPATDRWAAVEGLERELPKFLCGATLSGLGGQLCLVWEGSSRVGVQLTRRRKTEVISCALIDVSRTEGGLRGSVVWKEDVLAVPRGSAVAHCVAVEL